MSRKIKIKYVAKNLIDNYVDDIQEMVAPTTAQISKIDMEKIEMKATIDELKDKITDKTVENIKNNEANKLIELAIEKNIIDDDDKEIEMTKILNMNDEEFNKYKNYIINYSLNGEVTSNNIDDSNLTEAERALKKIKNGTFKNSPVNVDFSKFSSNSDTRDLSSIGTNVDYRNGFDENSVNDSIINNLNDNMNNEKKLDLSKFANLQGLKKPIVTSLNTISPNIETIQNNMVNELIQMWE